MSDEVATAGHTKADSMGAWKGGRNELSTLDLLMKPCLDNWECDSEKMQFVLSNDLILESILRHLPTRDLLRKRLVCNQWNRIVTKILKRRSDALITVKEYADLEALEECIKSSTEFPFREIHLQFTRYSRIPENHQKLGLFKDHSTFFTRLGLSCFDVPDTFIAFILSGPFNGIVSLTLDRLVLESEEENLFYLFQDNRTDSLSSLKKLQTITFGSGDVDPTFLVALLQSCPNLKRIENTTQDHLPAVVIGGKLGAVKSFRVICCTNDQNSNNYHLPSQVEKLTVDHRYGKNGGHTSCQVNYSSLEPLLKSNRNSLRHLKISAPLVGGGENNVNWPALQNLTSLKLMRPCEFPASVQQIFPALEAIQLCPFPNEYPDYCDYMWTQPFFSVTKLDIFRGLTNEQWTYLSQMVPNVRRIVMNYEACEIYDRENENTVVDPWGGASRFEHLEALCISPVKLGQVYLDEFLTGIPESSLKKVRMNPDLPVPPPVFVEVIMRERASVAFLSGLTKLVIRFNVPDDFTAEDIMRPEFRITPHIVAQYGFHNLIPAGLKVRFLYDHWSETAELMKEALGPGYDVVTFGHWNARLGDQEKEHQYFARLL